LTNFNTIVLWISLALFIAVTVTSIFVYLASKKYR
jgi:hypothetical protein